MVETDGTTILRHNLHDRARTLIFVAEEVAKRKNDGELDSSCFVAAAQITGTLKNLNLSFKGLTINEVLEQTSLPFRDSSHELPETRLSPIVSEIYSAAILQAENRNKDKCVQDMDILKAVWETPSIGSVALTKLLQSAQSKENLKNPIFLII